MAKDFCKKHDIVFDEGGKCWCCEQAKQKSAETPATATASKPTRVPVATGGKR